MNNDDDPVFTRHFALEFLVMSLYANRFSIEEIDDFALRMRKGAEAARIENRNGASMTRATVFGMNAPLMEVVAEILTAAADLGRTHAAPSPPADTSASLHDGDPKVVSLFSRAGRA